MNDVLVFESLFLIFLFANIALGFYLYLREAKSIREHRNKVPHVFSGLVSLDAHKAASDARLHADKVNEIRHLSNLVLVLLLTFGGGIIWFSSLLTSQLGNSLFTQILFALCVGLAFLVINGLFFAIAKNPEKNSSYLILRNFGSSRSKVSNVVFFVVIVSAVLTCRSFGASYWWTLAWAVSAILVIGASMVSRSVAYSAYPLTDGELKSRLDQFLEKAGFESRGVFVADSDRLGSDSGVFISGFGSNKKVVLTESLIERLNPSEIEAMIANEIGQYKYQTGVKVYLPYLIFSFVFFGLLSYFSTKSWFFQGLGISSGFDVNHGVVLVLFSLTAYVFLFPLIPLRNALLWKAEENAERSSVKLVDWNAMISGTAKFASDKAGSVTLDPLYLVFNSTRTDSMHRIMDIQHLAPRHTRQRDSWLPNA
ncbi:M48 family metalloprotease [uncultured Parasutterella sp.]|uniref:M48 family metalloprotease n=1 Tax=uncultured Parasutterella sp. TaxID=1263098 RepID=UPI0025FDB1F6|nr:M48 family metalloprotease [uncultured Parasutterella sp.]